MKSGGGVRLGIRRQRAVLVWGGRRAGTIVRPAHQTRKEKWENERQRQQERRGKAGV